MKKIVIASVVRTPLGKFGGVLLSLKAVELGALVAREAIKRAGINAGDVDELIFGHARQAGNGPNPARQVAFKASIPVESPAYTINQACASGMKAIINGCQSIALGDADVVVAGGMESMSNTPFLLTRGRWGLGLGNVELEDGMYKDGFMCPMANQLMGQTAETLAERYNISREVQDSYAAMTQQRCEAARKKGLFNDEIIQVELKGKKGESIIIDKDENPRDGVTPEALAKLPPAFKEGGTVHAGNSSGLTDGAAAVVLMSQEKAKALGVTPLAYISNYALAGVHPTVMGLGPVPAVRNLEKRANISIHDIELIELGEAFAAQVLACNQELNLDFKKVNVNGGNIALGHPIGCTGARLVVTLVHEMSRQDAKTGVATLCVSGGMGAALLLELP